MRSFRFKVADERLGVFQGDTPTQPERLRRAAEERANAAHWFTVGADPDASPASSPPATPERAHVESLVSMLELDHNTLKAEGDTHETAVEMDRTIVMAALEAIVMTATGALRATRPRPDLAASAAKDAWKAQAASIDAWARSAGPLGKSVAQELMRASTTAIELALAISRLPGGSPMPGGRPSPASSRPGQVAAGDDEAPPPGAPRRAGVAVLGALGLLGFLAATHRRATR